MRRREFLRMLGSMAAMSPLMAHAQQLPAIGFLGSISERQWTPFVAAFFDGLKEMGFVEKQNFRMEYRWADGQYDRLPDLATELIRARVDMIVAVAPPAALAAKAATNSIPIVFSSGADPVKLGLVASFNKPGANVTGVTFITAELVPKILELILELIPQAKTVGFLANPDNQNTVAQARDVQAAAQSLGREARIVYANTGEAIDKAFSDLAASKVDAIMVGTDAFFLNQKDRMVSLPQRYRIPAIYNLREYPAAGGLLSYGTSVMDTYRQIGLYAGRILKGTKPADLPVFSSSRFELIINLKTAKALGLSVPPTLVARSDEVIE
jgi:putative ABC transport system substrate-binding protein